MKLSLSLLLLAALFAMAQCQFRGFFGNFFGGPRRRPPPPGPPRGGRPSGGCPAPPPNYRYKNFGGQRYLPTWELGKIHVCTVRSKSFI